MTHFARSQVPQIIEAAQVKDQLLAGRQANLKDVRLPKARFDKTTVWPDYFNPTRMGAIFEE